MTIVQSMGSYMKKVVRVLVVDDSAYVRKVVKQMLSRSPFIEVVEPEMGRPHWRRSKL